MTEVEIAAVTAAAQVGVEVRELETVPEMRLACELLEDIWNARGSSAPASANLLRALHHAGHSVAGAFACGRLVGAAVAFRADRGAGPELHSHVVGVAAEMRGRNVGFAMKLHQRGWALEREIETMTWTFDPLVRRNAFFNIGKLGARPLEYLPDFYGSMDDGINTGDASDRILLSWDLTRPPMAGGNRVAEGDTNQSPLREIGLAVDEDGRPVVGDCTAPSVLVRVPSDIERMRQEDRELAAQWRTALRDALGGLMASGAEVTGFTRDGWYVVRRP